MTIIAKQPASADAFFDNVNPPNDIAGVTYWGSAHRHRPSRNPFHRWFTGVSVGRDQLATYPLLPWSTGVQFGGDEIGIMLQSWSLRRDLPLRYRLGTTVISVNPKQKLTLNSPLVYSFDLKVPSSLTFGGAVAQVVAYFSIVDTSIKRGFWLGLNVFDSRGATFSDGRVKWDDGTRRPIVSYNSPLHRSRRFSEYSRYRWTLTREGLLGAVDFLRRHDGNVNWSARPEDFYVGSVNLNPEIHVPDRWNAYAHIGLAVRGWKLEAET